MIADVVQRYKELLVESKVLDKEQKVLIEPTTKDFEEINDKVVVLQQGNECWDYSVLNKIDFIITSSIWLKNKYSELNKKTILLEFPIKDIFKKKTNWKSREDSIYYHGRVLPEKVPLLDLKKILQSGIEVVMRGPICKKYWTEEDIETEEFNLYKKALLEIKSEFDNLLLLPATEDENIIINELNKYKFYFTISKGEAFNVALQEAIACGTMPIVRRNQAYWWADCLFSGFSKVEDLIVKYNVFKDEDLEEYSDIIAKEIKVRCSLEAIHDKYERQLTQTHQTSQS